MVGAPLLERASGRAPGGCSPRTAVAPAISTPSPAPRDLGGGGTCPVLGALGR